MFDSFKFDAAGNRMYPGKTVRTLEWDVFTDTALPAWLTFTNNDSANLTFSVTPMSAYGGDGFCKLQWSGTPSTSLASNLALSFPFDLRQFHEVGFILKDVTVGTSLDAANKVDLTMAIHKYPNCGVWFKQNATTQKMECRIYNTSGTDDFTDVPYQIAGSGFGLGRKNIGMALCNPSKTAYLLGGDAAPVCSYQPTHPNGANSSWPVPASAAQMPVMTLEVINKIGANDANAWIKFSGIKVWFVTG